MDKIKVPWNQFIVEPFEVFDLLITSQEKPLHDAYIVYKRFLIQSIIQQNMWTDSTDLFMEKACRMSNARYRKAKKELINLWLIEVEKIRNEKWYIAWWVVKVNTYVSTSEDTLNKKFIQCDEDFGLVEPSYPQPTKSTLWITDDKEEIDNISNNNINNSNIYNSNNTNIINNNIVSIDDLSNNTSDNSKDNSSDKKDIRQTIIKEVYDRIAKEWLVYSSSNEDIRHAFILSNTSTFIKACNQVWWVQVLVRWIMEYVFTDGFWKWKVISIKDFAKNWEKFYSHLKVNWKFKVQPKIDSKKLSNIFDSI